VARADIGGVTLRAVVSLVAHGKSRRDFFAGYRVAGQQTRLGQDQCSMSRSLLTKLEDETRALLGFHCTIPDKLELIGNGQAPLKVVTRTRYLFALVG